MRTRLIVAWALLLASPLLALEPEVKLEIVSFPPSARAYLETSTGPVYLGLCGTPLQVTPPALRDRSGQVAQYTSGTLTLKLPNHQDLKVAVSPDQWAGGRLPPQGSLTLPPLGLATTAVDALAAHPWLWGLLAAAPLALLMFKAKPAGRPRLSGDPLLGRHLGDYLVQEFPGVFERVELPAAGNQVDVLSIALLRDAPRPIASRLWRDFLLSPHAGEILGRHGFDASVASGHPLAAG